MAAVRELLTALGEDPTRSGLLRTPERVADLLQDSFAGIGRDPAIALGTPIPYEQDRSASEDHQPARRARDAVAVRNIAFQSLCEHHLVPFTGHVDVAYVPARFLGGLGRIAALVREAARRPQLQEHLGARVADTLIAVLAPESVLVRITAYHACVAYTEPGASRAEVVTVVTRGVVDDPHARALWASIGPT
ncbi:hypothetical protein ASF40_09175 [Microbacterium sp. Leaf288]|nr:hypothetical protein ASF40_09175 [Microbacterium sp. Leaf288]